MSLFLIIRRELPLFVQVCHSYTFYSPLRPCLYFTTLHYWIRRRMDEVLPDSSLFIQWVVRTSSNLWFLDVDSHQTPFVLSSSLIVVQGRTKNKGHLKTPRKKRENTYKSFEIPHRKVNSGLLLFTESYLSESHTLPSVPPCRDVQSDVGPFERFPLWPPIPCQTLPR